MKFLSYCFSNPLCCKVTVIDCGKRFSEQQPLSVVQLCQMKHGLIYVNTNNMIECVLYRVAVLRKTQCGISTYNTGWQF